MGTRVEGVFDEALTESISKSKILVVGAGGIGCEILKNLVLTGFPDIEIVSTIPLQYLQSLKSVSAYNNTEF